MLEVLDPEQNATFRDNYLGVPFDLSRVVFLATANMLDTIPGPLRDRMEIISLAGYTEGEKLQIAQRYLVQRQLEANGLKAEQAEIDEDALRHVIHDYTREAGVRSLEREDRQRIAQRRGPFRGGQHGESAHRPRRISRRSSGRRDSKTKWRCARACRVLQRGSRGRRSAATSCSSRPRVFPAKAR